MKVLINGFKGKMGDTAVTAVTNEDGLEFVGGVEKGDDLLRAIQDNNPDVVVDLTHPTVVFENCQTILSAGKSAVVGTTGLSDAELQQLDALAKEKNVAILVCPNFAISAILMMRFAKEAAKWMQRCEIIEYHHDKKADAPSGTAIKTAQMIAEAASDINKEPLDEEELYEGARGATVENIPVHAIRIPGVVANQEVIFGTQGQSLSIRHDTINRDAFMPGLMMAIKATKSVTGLVYGLENVLV